MNIYQTIYRFPLCLLGLLGLTLGASPLAAQVFESGPSDPRMFDNFLSLPNDPNIISRQSSGGDESTIRINVTPGGTIGSAFDAFSGTEINIRGGSVGEEFDAFSGSEINITDGSAGANFDANSGSEINISGGIIGDGFNAFSGSVVNISGGSIGDDFDALPGSQINIFGSDFVLDGVSLDDEIAMIDGMPIDDGTPMGDEMPVIEPFTVVTRDVTLTGLYADGTEFSFDLKSVFEADEDFFSTGATLTLTLGPPGDIIIVLGDVNLDEVVDLLDIAPFIQSLATGSFSEQADCNQDGIVNFLDILSFIAILSGS